MAAVTGRMLSLLPAERALADGPVTIGLDTTDVEVYGAGKRGVAWNHQGQRVGRPHVAARAETGTVLAAGLGDGTDDPRATAPGLLRRALAALPPRARQSGRVGLRADAGYFAGQLARAARDARIGFAIGARRIAPLRRLLAGIPGDARRDAIEMGNAQVAVAQYCPGWWPASTRLLIRRVLPDADQVPAGPRSRRRRTLHPDQRALPVPEPASAGAIYACSFILANLDVAAAGKAAAAEHWYRHRTTVENIFRDSRPGAALRHLPSGYPQVNLAWMWRALLAANRAAWLHQLTAFTAGEDIPGRTRRPRRQGHDRHLAPAADRRPRPADPPCPPPGAAAPARPLPASRGPHPAAAAARTGLTCAPRAPAPSP